MRFWGFILTFLFLQSMALATPQFVRWTGSQDKNSDLNHIVDVVNSKTGLSLKATDFFLIEDRSLAHNRFQMFVETASGIPIHSMSIRAWTDLKTADSVQVEAFVDTPVSFIQLLGVDGKRLNPKTLALAFDSQKTMDMIKTVVRSDRNDSQIRNIRWTDEWKNNNLVRLVRVTGKHGTHLISISLFTQQVIDHEYVEFPQGDLAVPAQVYPIYEQPAKSSNIQQRVSVTLKYIKDSVARVTADPYKVLMTRQYTDDMMDPVLGHTPQGAAQGYWSMSDVKESAAKIRAALPTSSNDFQSGGVILEGRYATVSLHPDAATKFQGLNFIPSVSPQFKPDWRPMPDGMRYQMIPGGALLGKPLTSITDAWGRPAQRVANNDPVTYMNDGFDEIQVYYAINTLMESLQSMGFNDPELSTRPFNAFLYDPDISMKDNAFYTDDTINFTTYSPNAQNFARDNSTIWHELGHGIMDRLMGDSITLADTGGLSEGMADFVAALIIQNVTKGRSFDGDQDFRIINNTGFLLTNEVHDDGEAYGGTMKDLLTAAVGLYGQDGLVKVTDLTLEAMRLSRNHPALTAQDWFNHMLFADQLGNGDIRAPGELGGLLTKALAGRNYRMDSQAPASFTLMNGNAEITNRGDGSRNRPISLALKATDTATYHLTASLKSSDQYQFAYPVQVKVVFKDGPLQGAIRWEGKDKQPLVYTLKSENDVLPIDLTAHGTCDQVNRDDGSCVDYAYIQIWNSGGQTKPVAKKRFYLRIKTVP